MTMADPRRSLCVVGLGLVRDRVEKSANVMMFFQRVTERVAVLNVVAVAAAFAFTGDVAAIFEVVDYLHGGSFCHPDELGEVSDAQVGCLCDRQEHVRVVGEEGPGTLCGFSCHAPILPNRNTLHEI